MDLRTTKLKLIKTILENDNAEFLRKLARIVEKEDRDFWDDLSEAEKEEIQKGIEDLDKGKRISYHAFLKKIS